MRVLWFTTSMMPAMLSSSGQATTASGPWMYSLLAPIAKSLASLDVCAFNQQPRGASFSHEGITYHIIPARSRNLNWRRDDAGVARLLELVERVNPDVIHIHGTELQYGLLLKAPHIHRKALVTLQGLVGPYSRASWGDMTTMQALKLTSFSQLIRGTGVFHSRRELSSRGKRERQILQHARYVGGRTLWDKAYWWAHSNHNESTYFHLEEHIRDDFFSHTWNVEKCKSWHIAFSNASGPIKGIEDLLLALKILSDKGFPVRLTLAGRVNSSTPYGKALRRLISVLQLEEKVTFAGYLSAPQIVAMLLEANVFVSASYIDNSPNSIVEAQLLGVPIVATQVGGVPDLFGRENAGILIPRSSPESLAFAIASICNDSVLATKLSEASRRLSRARNSSLAVCNSLLECYREIMSMQVRTS